MAKPVTHLSKIRQIGPDSFRTGTVCGRMVGSGDLNCTSDELDVTCKFCLPVIRAYERSFLIENGMPV
jgi:hypothetical protein